MVVDPAGLRWQILRTAQLPDLAGAGGTVGIDIPIGLRAAGQRAADQAARARLGAARSSVFFAPIRPLLGAATHREASDRNEGVEGRRISLQTFGILARVAEVDALLQGDPGARAALVEVHPEVSFRAMSRRGDLAGKKTAEGRQQRRAAVEAWLGGPLALPRLPPARPDDLLDALACAWTAQRWADGRAAVLGEEQDEVGLPARIVV